MVQLCTKIVKGQLVLPVSRERHRAYWGDRTRWGVVPWPALGWLTAAPWLQRFGSRRGLDDVRVDIAMRSRQSAAKTVSGCPARGCKSSNFARRLGCGAAGFDHTLITPNESVGVMGRKRPASIHLKSTTYDWFGRGQVARSGFDSRWRTWS